MGIQDAFDGRVYYSQGCHIVKSGTSGLARPNDRIAEAVATAQHCDIVILCVGLDANLEGEEGDAGNEFDSGDKFDLRLPQSQRTLIDAVLAVGKPTVVVLAAGSSLNPECDAADALIQTWYPGSHGGEVLADILFGRISPSGKLPITFYETADLLPDFADYSTKNRTYRFVEGNVLYPFGFGLTYSQVDCVDAAYADGKVQVTVQNVGDMATEDVVQVYIKDNKSPHAIKNPRLCGFKRLHLLTGEQRVIEIELDKTAFDVVDDAGRRFVDSDSFTVFVGTCQPDGVSRGLTNGRIAQVDVKR